MPVPTGSDNAAGPATLRRWFSKFLRAAAVPIAKAMLRKSKRSFHEREKMFGTSCWRQFDRSVGSVEEAFKIVEIMCARRCRGRMFRDWRSCALSIN